MAVNRKLTVRDKRMVGFILAIVLIIYGLRRFYSQGLDQIANAIKVSPDNFKGITDDVSQIGEGYVMYRILGSVLQKGWVKTVATFGYLLYALDGVFSFLGHFLYIQKYLHHKHHGLDLFL